MILIFLILSHIFAFWKVLLKILILLNLNVLLVSARRYGCLKMLKKEINDMKAGII